MVKYNYFYLIFICLIGLTTYSQKVSKITFKQEQSNILVSYDLETKTPCKVSLYVSTIGGTSWQGPLKKVTGNVGDKVISGKNSILWNVLEEFQELSGNEIKFQVRAEESKTKSIASINNAIIKNPKDAKLFKLRGDLKHELEDTDGAIADYNKAISLNPKYADAYKERGKLMFGNYKAAISDYSKAISLNPKDASTFYDRANSKCGLEDYKGAISDYSKALELEPNNTTFLFSRASAKADSNEYNGAIEDINRVIELDSTYNYDGNPMGMYYIRGIYKYSNKDFEGFDKDINHYVKYSTNQSEALSKIAQTFVHRKEYSNAIEYYTKSIDLLPETLVDSLEQRVVYLGRAISSYMQKNESSSSDDFNKYIEKSQNKAKANFNIAEVFLDDGMYSSSYSSFFFLDVKNLNKAIFYFTKSIELDPNNSSYYERRASAKEELKDYTGALADYSKSIELEPDAYSYYKSATLKVELEDYRGAITDYSKAIELKPDASNFSGRASAKFSLLDYRGAIVDYSKAIELDYKDLFSLSTYYYFYRGNAKFNIRDYKGAISDYTKVILNQPQNGKAYLWRGNAKKMIKDKKGACKDFSKAGELGEDEAYESINENCNK
jgi:tetratricopeptide (TPR) repeat protein